MDRTRAVGLTGLLLLCLGWIGGKCSVVRVVVPSLFAARSADTMNRAFVERARGPPPRRSIRLIDDDPCRECAAFRTSAGRSVPSLFCFCSRRDADGLFAAAIMPRLERPDDNSRAASCHHRTCWPKITIGDCFEQRVQTRRAPFSP